MIQAHLGFGLHGTELKVNGNSIPRSASGASKVRCKHRALFDVDTETKFISDLPNAFKADAQAAHEGPDKNEDEQGSRDD